MRKNFLSVLITCALAAVPIASFAQTTGQAAEKSGSQSAAPNPAAPAGSMENRYGRSPHCEPMTGASKEQCLRDEAEKTQGSQPDDKASQGAAGAGSTSPSTPAVSAPKAPSTTEASPAEKQ